MLSNIEKRDWNESFKGGQNELWQWGHWVMSKWCLLRCHRDRCRLMRIPHALFCMLVSTFILMITRLHQQVKKLSFLAIMVDVKVRGAPWSAYLELLSLETLKTSLVPWPPSATDPLRCFVAIALNKSRVVQSKTHVSVCHSPLLDHQTWELRFCFFLFSHWCATSDTSLVVRCQIGVDVEVRGPPWSACLWSHTKLFCDSKLHLSRQKRRGVYAENVSTRKEFLVEDDWLLLMSPKGQTAHQNLLTNPSAFFFPKICNKRPCNFERHSIHRLGARRPVCVLQP